jgi:hypothetical protein
MAADAFALFDRNKDGGLDSSELFAGVSWLGLDLAPTQVFDLVAVVDGDGDGLISQEDFVSAFHIAGDEYETQADTTGFGAAARSSAPRFSVFLSQDIDVMKMGQPVNPFVAHAFISRETLDFE